MLVIVRPWLCTPQICVYLHPAIVVIVECLPVCLLAEDGQTEWPSTILTTTVLFSSTFGLDNVVHYVEKTNGLGTHNLNST